MVGDSQIFKKASIRGTDPQLTLSLDFEKGKSSVEWGLVFRTLKELGLDIDLAESRQIPPSPAEDDLMAILERGRRRP
jgi:hypothetical protein